MIFCVGLFVFELGLTHYLINESLSIMAFLVFHGIGMGVFWLVLKQRHFAYRKINLYLFALSLTTLSGVFGAATALLTALLFLYNRQKTFNHLKILGLEDSIEKKVDEEPELIASLQEEDIKHKAHVIPFKEILTTGNNQQKIEALSKISQHYRPEFAHALLIAKKDEKNNIRVLSASTISKIDQMFMRRYKNLSLKHDQNPDSIIVLLNLAKHASAYADCGVLDTYREKNFREKSIEFFQKYLKLRPMDKESQLTLAKLYLKNKQPSKAIDIFQNLMRHKVHLNLIDLFWYFEALYEIGNYQAIRDQIKKLEKLNVLSQNKELFILNDILKPWVRGYIKREEIPL